MKFLSILSFFIVITFLFTACQAGTAAESTATFEPATLPPPPATPLPESTPTTASTPVDACKIPSTAFTNVGLGFPKPTHKLPTVGTVTTIVLFVDFSDAPASQTPEEVFSLISPSAEKFFSDISYGVMNYVLEPHFTWLRLSQPSSFYGAAIGSYEGHLNFIQETVNLADADVDFSAADSVLVMVPPQASDVGYGPAFGGNPGVGYTADGRVFSNGVTSGADLLNWGYLWLNHETGHTMLLPDLYAYQYDSANYEDQHRFVGGFRLMGFIAGNAPEFLAFERWNLGWLEDSQIVCQLTGTETTTLSAIEAAGGTKAVIVPISSNKVLVIESRRALGYDTNLIKAGALVYTVDTSVFSGEGTIQIFPRLENDPYLDYSPLAVGESVTVDGVTVTVLEAAEQGDTVQVTVGQ